MPKPATIMTLKCTPKYNYSEVLEKSLLFYEAQRSGRLPSNNRIPWRKDSAFNDGSDHGNDLTGGFYNAEGYRKLGFSMAASITNLAWGMIEFKRGYVFAGQYQHGLDALKWGTDYFIKCHTKKEEYWAEIGDSMADSWYFGRPEDMTMARPSFKMNKLNLGSEVAGETAAALTATSIVFKEAGDNKYAAILLNHAKELLHFATNKLRGCSGLGAMGHCVDELAWACLWLFKATNEMEYKKQFAIWYKRGGSKDVKEFSWENKWVGVHVLAATMKITQTDPLAKLSKLIQNTKRTPKGLLFIKKGPNSYAANIAFLSLIASKVKDSKFYTDFTRQQIHYMLGDSGRSYVVGFGFNPPKRPYHKSSSCADPPAECNMFTFVSKDPNPHTLYGALVGGPDASDDYKDTRREKNKNAVAIEYNAGFQSAIAGLVELAFDGMCENSKSMAKTMDEKLDEQLQETIIELKSIINVMRNV